MLLDKAYYDPLIPARDDENLKQNTDEYIFIYQKRKKINILKPPKTKHYT